MRLAPLLLAAPVVFSMAAADPRAAPNRRVLDRWEFARQAEASSTAGGGGGGGGGAGSSTPAALPTSTSTTPAAAPTSSSAAETSSSRAAETPTSTSTSTTPAQPSSTSSTSRAAAASSTSSTAAQQSPSSTSNAAAVTPSQQSNQAPTSTSFSLSTPPPTTAAVSTTDQHGNVVTSYIIFTQAPTSVVASASATSTPAKTGVSQSTVIGLAVTGSIAGLLIILLIVWKLTNKRFSDLEDTGDDDAIKWPELNKDSAAMTPIPARPSTRATGAETDTLGADFDRQSAAHSAADLSYPPYSDDPGYGARPQYYDPYGGAPADAQYYDVPRGASPGPNAIARGMSPGPGMAYDNRVASPAPPNMAYADPVARTGSPGPGGYGYGGGYAPDPYSGRHSPGPNMAYGQPEVDPYGRRSPGPGMAYNGSVGRVASPGPNAPYR
ncbi:hypothetical protein OPQ81_001320 [Rhizoctonia solani]|nr:hypothetical protein OPQ81_001320 [Rhizoctonia solani]